MPVARERQVSLPSPAIYFVLVSFLYTSWGKGLGPVHTLGYDGAQGHPLVHAIVAHQRLPLGGQLVKVPEDQGGDGVWSCGHGCIIDEEVR